MNHHKIKISSGFTLMELMVIIIILGIIVTIAFPTYNHFTDKARVEEAKADLIENIQFLNRFYAKNFSYYVDTDKKKYPELPITQSKNKLYNYAVSNTGVCDGLSNNQDSFCIMATANGKKTVFITNTEMLQVCDETGKNCE